MLIRKDERQFLDPEPDPEREVYDLRDALYCGNDKLMDFGNYESINLYKAEITLNQAVGVYEFLGALLKEEGLIDG